MVGQIIGVIHTGFRNEMEFIEHNRCFDFFSEPSQFFLQFFVFFSLEILLNHGASILTQSRKNKDA